MRVSKSVSLPEKITRKDILHLVDRAERVLDAIEIDRNDPEQMMSTFKLNNTCKAWRKELEAITPDQEEKVAKS